MLVDDDAIRGLVTRLSRKDRSGGQVIERAAILAEGANLEAVVGWIVAHDGQPEARVPSRGGNGLHGSRVSASAGADGPPLRYVLPAAALAEPEA
jgi:hypothetical protein